jgi:hypothetical protein
MASQGRIPDMSELVPYGRRTMDHFIENSLRNGAVQNKVVIKELDFSHRFPPGSGGGAEPGVFLWY